MRKQPKEAILKLICTIGQAHGEIRRQLEQGKLNVARDMLAQCQEAALGIANTIEKSEGESCPAIACLLGYCEYLFKVYSNLEMYASAAGGEMEEHLEARLTQIEDCVKNKIPVRREVVFFPYKISMWDALESVYLAAKEDPECDVYCVPIPYFDRNPDGSLGEMHYEGAEYPENVEITDWQTYNFESRRPDVMFIHNPYDDCNLVTCVHPRFFSRNLKQYTSKLVYIPYFVARYYDNEKTVAQNIPKCIDSVDLCILQSEKQKMGYGITEEYRAKMVVLGSPKLDRIINTVMQLKIPQELIKKIGNRKTILLNSPIPEFLSDPEWEQKINNIIDLFKKNPKLFLIWRPHPLLFATMHSMRPKKAECLSEIVQKIDVMDNALLDQNISADIAIAVSDAMISGKSSLILQYTATEKPVLVTAGSASARENHFVCCDYFSNYFLEDGESIEDFLSLIIENRDYKREDRMKHFKNSLVNADGSCGKKIYNYVKGLECV